LSKLSMPGAIRVARRLWRWAAQGYEGNVGRKRP
jgi:hypothetical protein